MRWGAIPLRPLQNHETSAPRDEIMLTRVINARKQTSRDVITVSGCHPACIRHGGEIVVRVIGLHRPLAISVGLAKLQPRGQIVLPRGRITLQSARIRGNHLACRLVNHQGFVELSLHLFLQFTLLDWKLLADGRLLEDEYPLVDG